MVGQYQRPRTLKEILHLRLEYTGQSNSWIDRKIFKNWVFYIFVPSMKEYFRKVGMPEDTKFMLSLDNCNVHSCQFELQLGNISVLYLPSNAAPLIQPMDQGVVQNVKCCYRRDPHHLAQRLKEEYSSTPHWAFVACSKVNFIPLPLPVLSGRFPSQACE